MTWEHLPQFIESNIDKAIRQVNTIKGLSAQLGTDEFYEYSKELESALNSNKPHEDSLSIFMEGLMDVMDELGNMEGWKLILLFL